ncbi:hypothetical protein [Thiocapsa rosea]|nr:hypothetical protein [Thiocapsa rosea]
MAIGSSCAPQHVNTGCGKITHSDSAQRRRSFDPEWIGWAVRTSRLGVFS